MNTKIIAVIAALNLSGCASILSGTNQDVRFESEPQGALVTLEDQTCVTPCTLKISKGKEYIAKFKHEGREPQSVTLTKEFNPISILNLFGLVGWIVDAGTGAIYSVNPETVNADMVSMKAVKN